MKIYKNTKGDCSGLAVANAINERFGVEIPQVEVERLYKRHDWTIRGARLIDLLTVLKHSDSLYGFKVKSFRVVYFDGSDKNPALELRHCMANPATDLLLSLWMRKPPKGGRKLKLDSDYNLIPYTSEKISTHGLFIKEYDWMEHRHVPVGFMIINNWGADWGMNGAFYMKFPQLQTECCQLFEVEFERV